MVFGACQRLQTGRSSLYDSATTMGCVGVNDSLGPSGPIRFDGSATNVSPQRTQAIVSFDRRELGLILNVYGKKVASGEWRDYALDMGRERAMFSIYKRTSERPLFVIEKNPKLARRQGQYMVFTTEGRILKRGHDLANVLRILDPDLYVVR